MKSITKILNILNIKYKLLNQKIITGKDLKIQFGSGNNFITGWINSDIPSAFADYKIYPDAYIDISKNLPIKSKSCKFLYNEHLIEHIDCQSGELFLKECYRILQKGGILRIATPDLQYLTNKYASQKWQSQDWLTWPEYKFIKTPAEMLNIAMRWWGHKYLYDETELKRRLADAGFKKIKRCEMGKSEYIELKKRETRIDSKLVIEATK